MEKMLSTYTRVPINLKPEEAAILSFVARYAQFPEAKPKLETMLRTSTDTARNIGAAILDSSLVTEEKYRVMADRYVSRDLGKQKPAARPKSARRK